MPIFPAGDAAAASGYMTHTAEHEYDSQSWYALAALVLCKNTIHILAAL
jgi:hypothetical protein